MHSTSIVGENDVLILVENTCIKNRPSKFQMLANKTWVVFHKNWMSNMVLYSPFKQNTWTFSMMVMLWGLQFFEEQMLFGEKAMFFSIDDATIDRKISCKTNYKGGYKY